MVRRKSENGRIGLMPFPVAPENSRLVGHAVSMPDPGCCSLSAALSMGGGVRKIRLSWRVVTVQEADEVYHRQVHFAEDY
jgi:hypothetical protein